LGVNLRTLNENLQKFQLVNREGRCSFYFLCLCKESNKESTADFDAELFFSQPLLGQNRR